jgi:hypothetical protein
MHVAQERQARTEALAQAHRLGSAPLDDPLVGDHGPGVDVDAHEGRTRGRRDPQGRSRVVAQDIDPHRQTWRGLLHRVNGQGHGGNRLGGDRRGEEGRVPEVLHDQGVGTSVRQRARVGLGGLQHGRKVPSKAGRAGKGTKVDDPHEGRTAAVEERCEGGHCPPSGAAFFAGSPSLMLQPGWGALPGATSACSAMAVP